MWSPSRRTLKIVGAVAGTLCLLIGLAAVAAWHFVSGMCANTTMSEVVSPNGEHKAVVFVRDCGATTGYSTQVSVIEADENLANEGGNVFVEDSGHGSAPTGKNRELQIKTSWASDSLLKIEHHTGARTFKTEAMLQGVKVEYVHAQ